MTDLTGLIPHGWSGGEAVTKWWRGKFVHLYRLRKPCAQCGTEMVLDVTKAAISGTAKNAGLHLVRCLKCRQSTPRDITSRPTTEPERHPTVTPAYEPQVVSGLTKQPPLESDETAGLHEKINSVELRESMYVQSIQNLQAEVTALKSRLAAVQAENATLKAKYEFNPAVLKTWNEINEEKWKAEQRAKNNLQKLPWEA